LERNSLRGLTIAVTSSRRAHELAHIIEVLGGKPYIAPTMGIKASQIEIKTQVKRFLRISSERAFDIAIFMTGPGTESIFSASRELGVIDTLVRNLRSLQVIIARSPKPKSILSKYKITENVQMPGEATVKGIETLLLTENFSPMSGKNVAVFWHGESCEQMIKLLGDLGAHVSEFATYSYFSGLTNEGTSLLESSGFANPLSPEKEKVTNLIEDLIAKRIDVITFTSPPAVTNLFNAAGPRSEELRDSLNRQVIVTSIGPSTCETLASYNVKVDVVPEIFKLGKMIESLAEHVKAEKLLTKPNTPYHYSSTGV
jgi:uroporphyrinogen-III synthase